MTTPTYIVVNNGGTVHVHNHPTATEPPRPRRVGLLWPVVMLASQYREHLADLLGPLLS